MSCLALYSRETLCKVTQNDASLKILTLVDDIGDDRNDGEDGDFYSDNSGDYSTLGAAIANNTHLNKLTVWLSDDLPLGVANREFYDGLQRNSSIHHLSLVGDTGQLYRVGQEILQAYRENNSQLTFLTIKSADLQSGGNRVVADTLRCCINLQIVTLNSCSITDEQLLPINDALREHRKLETLDLAVNLIGSAGCDAIATLLEEQNFNLRSLNLGINVIGNEGATTIANSLINNTKLEQLHLFSNRIDYQSDVDAIVALLIDPNCNLQHLNLGNNAIDNEGLTTIANSLINNKKLQQLYLYGNPIDQTTQDAFCNLLCSTSNMNSTYLSNHTLQSLQIGHHALNHENRQQLESLLAMNEDDNKSHIAIKKILKYHPNIDMDPMFEWGLDEDGERNLKALPYVIDWFRRAKEVVADEVDENSSSDSNEDEDESYNVAERKLSAIFQFAKAMPLLLEGITRL